VESSGRTRRARRGLAWFALALACAGCATTGSVKGNVTAPDKKGKTDEAVVSADRTDAKKKKKRKEPAPAQAVLLFTDGRFLPSTLLVDPGTVVRIENRDRIYHNAFSVASNAPFDVGGIAPGKSASVHFDRSGVVKVFCEFHRHEGATIVVAPAKSRTHPSADGDYRIGGLPDGTYRVTSWHPAYGTMSKLVAIAGHDEVTVDFRY
jgi:plastocyanin